MPYSVENTVNYFNNMAILNKRVSQSQKSRDTSLSFSTLSMSLKFSRKIVKVFHMCLQDISQINF